MNKSMEKVSSDKGEALKNLYYSFLTGINNFKATAPREFLDNIGLDYQKLHLGFNSGQFHHRKSDEFKAPYIELGVLKVSDAPTREKDMVGYKVFGDYGVIFPLKDEADSIVNMYAYRIKLQTPKGEYLNDSGLYPTYPNKRSTRLILTDNVLDAASILQSDTLENRDAVIALNDGELTENIKSAIQNLVELEQVIILSTTENSKLEEDIKQLNPVPVSSVQIPEASLNEFFQLYNSDGIVKLLEEAKPEQLEGFQCISDREFYYKGDEVNYLICGIVSQNPTLLEMDFEIETNRNNEVLKEKLDLLNEKKTSEKIYFWTENQDLNYSQMVLELQEIKKELETVRRSQNKETTKRGFSTKQDKLAKQILRSDNLFKELNELIGKAGIVGEEKSRLLLFIIASSYKFKYNLHAIIHAEDITTGSELVSKIAELLPENEQYLIDLTTSRSFRYYGNSAINNKLIVIPDYSGVTSSRSIGDLKRLQAKGSIINDAPVKGKDGFLNTVKQTVNGHCSSIGACSKSKKHFEGEPRTVLVSMDTSPEQNQKLMEYDCLLMAGQIDLKAQDEAKELLQYVIRNIHSLEVVNPYATALMLPTKIRNTRMLTMQLNQFVSLITLFNQHKREKDKHGRVIATTEDNQTGIDLFLDALMLNIDELDAGTREFFDSLKKLMMASPNKEKTKLTSLEIQKELGLSKSHANRFLSTLVHFEYVKREGHRNTGFTYMVKNWDELSSIKKLIQQKLGDQTDPNQNGSPQAA